jgi:hypothetical protein
MERATPMICPECGSKKTVTFLFTEPAAPPRMFIRCAECAEFLARITVAKYSSFESFESVLHNLSFAQSRSFGSARELDGMIERFDDDVRANYDKAHRVLSEHPTMPVPQ